MWQRAKKLFDVADKMEGGWSIGMILLSAGGAFASFFTTLGEHGLSLAIPSAAVTFSAILFAALVLRKGSTAVEVGFNSNPTCRFHHQPSQPPECYVLISIPITNHGNLPLQGLTVRLFYADLKKPSSGNVTCTTVPITRQVIHPKGVFSITTKLHFEGEEISRVLNSTLASVILVRVFLRDVPVYDMWAAWDSSDKNSLRMATDDEILKTEVHIRAYIEAKEKV